MTKVTIDRALIEHATELFERQVMGEVPWSLMEAHQAEFALRAALAEPAVEPVMWAWQRDDGSWYDASATHHSRGMKPLYTSPPPPAVPVEVPLLNPSEHEAIVAEAESLYSLDTSGSWRKALIVATEAAVRRKAGL